MKAEQQRVRNWMIRFGQETHNCNPIIPSLEVRKLRAKLILEEALETIEGLGFTVSIPAFNEDGVMKDKHVHIAICSFNNFDSGSLHDIADGIADSLVVQLGTAVACGINIQPVFEEVMRSNDSKLWTNIEIAKFNLHDIHSYTFTCLKCNKITDKGCMCLSSLESKHWLVKDKDGKVIKSPSYSPPNIAPLLNL